jgi:hypothetical protein
MKISITYIETSALYACWMGVLHLVHDVEHKEVSA